MITNKTELLSNIQECYESFKTLITKLGAVQTTHPGVIGEWSVKDILAHIVIHEQRMLDWMMQRLGGVNPTAYQPYDMPERELDELNEQIYQENRNREWVDVLQDWEKTYTQTLAFVKAADEETLMTTRQFQLLNGEALWEAVAANTYEHYEEHGREILAWMAANEVIRK